jgi:pyridoxal biosynthesis lyase PdxS
VCVHYLQVDEILEQLSVFWANTEVVLDLLTKKGQHVEQFIGFASKPRLMARFRERMEEYKRFWENVSMMCSNYIAGVQNTNDAQRMYGFLETELTQSSRTGTPTPGKSAKSAVGSQPNSMKVGPYGPVANGIAAAGVASPAGMSARPHTGVGGGLGGSAHGSGVFNFSSPMRN